MPRRQSPPQVQNYTRWVQDLATIACPAVALIETDSMRSARQALAPRMVSRVGRRGGVVACRTPPRRFLDELFTHIDTLLSGSTLEARLLVAMALSTTTLGFSCISLAEPSPGCLETCPDFRRHAFRIVIERIGVAPKHVLSKSSEVWGRPGNKRTGRARVVSVETAGQRTSPSRFKARFEGLSVQPSLEGTGCVLVS